MTDSVLLVHDDPDRLRTLGARFEQRGSEVLRELTPDAAVATLDRARPDVVLLARHLAKDGTIGRLAGSEAPVIVFGEGDGAIEPLTAGAALVVEPGDDDLLVTLASRHAALGRRRRLVDALARMSAPRLGLEALGTSNAMRQLAHQLSLLAQSERTTLLLTGESGVGKAWAARVIHGLGTRTAGPFLEVRLTGQNPTYLDSLLFGHEKAAFVEATERRRGLIELADGGTLLLREIADLPAELQPKLLKVLETRSYRRLGGTQDLTVDTRLMVSTRRDLGVLVETERFRQDLFYRLSVVSLAIPALRERTQEDRLTLVNAVHGSLRTVHPEGPAAISGEAMERLLTYAWPGNAREVEGVLDRCMVLARGQLAVNVEHLPGEFRARPGLGDRRHTPMSLDDLEHQHIERTLRYHGGNRTRAAKELGISRATLINKIKLYSITD
ncbi:MAG: sigma-54-dependent transcriptional regulator [Gemmatimonadales bacterium]